MNKKTYRIITSMLLALMIILAVGCGKKPAQQAGQTTTVATQATTQASTSAVAQENIAEETTQAAAKESTVAETAPSETTPAETTTQQNDEPRYYTMEDVEQLENTQNFSKSAIEHIFNGTINSKGKGSGYHYDMIEDSDGYIVEGTRSEEDINGLYTANVEVDGHKKDHYSTFFPDSWSPQQVVDAINEAREDAIENDRHRGDTWIGYCGDIEIDMYFDSKDRVVSAFPIYEDDKR